MSNLNETVLAVVEAIGPIVKEYVQAQVKPLQHRIEAIEGIVNRGGATENAAVLRNARAD